MKLTEEIKSKLESTDAVAYEKHINNFIDKVESIAKISNVRVTTDLDVLKFGMLHFMDYNFNIRKLLKKLHVDLDARERDQFEGISRFKTLYKEACLGLLKTLKRTQKRNIDWSDLVHILGTLQVEE